MTGNNSVGMGKRDLRRAFGLYLLLIATAIPASEPVQGQSGVPTDQFHLSITLGGHFLVGVGYTHWIENHHALEFTAFPFAHPKEGFPFGLRAGYAWVPSDEVWRAKLGANVMVLIRPNPNGGNRFTLTLGITPGIQYFPDHERSFRADFWMSYYLREGIFIPNGLEFLYLWPK